MADLSPPDDLVSPPNDLVDAGGPPADLASAVQPLAPGEVQDLTKSSAVGAAGRGAVRGAAPAVGGLAGAVAGAEAGAGLGAFAGPLAWIASPALGLAGGLAGGYYGAEGVQRLQDAAMSRLPQSWRRALGQDEAQQRADIAQHPYASFAGELAPNLALLRPGKLASAAPEGAGIVRRAFSSPITARLTGAGLMGAQEAGSEEAQQGTVDPGKMAIAAGAGALMNRPTRAGEAVMSAATAPQRVLTNIARGRPADTPIVPPDAAQPPADLMPESAPVPQSHPAPGEAVGVRFKNAPPRRAEVDHYFDNGNAVRLRMDDGSYHDMTTADLAKSRTEPPQPMPRPTEIPGKPPADVGMDEASFPDDWYEPQGQPRPASKPSLGADMLNALDHADTLERTAMNGSLSLSAGARQDMLAEAGRLRRLFGHAGDETTMYRHPGPNRVGDMPIRPGETDYEHPMAQEPARDLGELAAARTEAPDLYEGERRVPPPQPAAPGLPGMEGRPAAPPGVDPYAMEDVSTARAPLPKVESLFDAIRALGGIRDDRGDVAQIMQGFKNEPFKRRVLNPQGQAPDAIREALQEQGWFGNHDRFGPNALETGSYPGDDIRDLYDLMDREARGEKVYHPDSDTAQQLAYRKYLDEELGRAGVLHTDNNEQAARKLAQYRSERDADQHAWESSRAVEDDLHPEDLEALTGHGYEPGADFGTEFEEPSGHAEGARGPEPAAGEPAPDHGRGEPAPGGGEGPAEAHPSDRPDLGPGVDDGRTRFQVPRTQRDEETGFDFERGTAVDGQGRPVDQFINEAGAHSAKQMAAAREAQGRGKIKSDAQQRGAGPLFGEEEPKEPEQGSLFQRSFGRAGEAKGETIKLADDLLGRTLGNVSPQEAKLLNQIEHMAEKIVPRASVRVMRALRMEPGMAAEAGVHPDSRISGATYASGLRRLIALSLESPNIMHTLGHEALHYLRARGLIMPKEWAALEKAAVKGDWLGKHDVEQRWATAPDWLKREEAIAEETGQWRRAPDSVPKAFRPMYERISRFMAKIADHTRRIFGREVTADDVMSRIMSGEIGRRNRQEVERTEPAFAQADKPEKPLTEKQFYNQYMQHIDARGRDSGKALETRDAVMREGFNTGRPGPFTTNAQRPLRPGEEPNAFSRQYQPKKGDVVYLAPREGWVDTGNGTAIKHGWKPKPYEAIHVTDPSKSMYEHYLDAFNRDQTKFQMPRDMNDVGDRLDSAASDMADEMKAAPPGTYRRTLDRMMPPSGDLVFKDPNAVQNVTLRPETMARLDSRSAAVWNAWKAKDSDANTMVDDLRSRIADTMLKLNDSERNKVYAARELDRINNFTRPDTGHQIVVRNDGTDSAHFSKPGQTVTLSPKETAAYHALSDMFDRSWKNVMEGAARKVGYTGPWDKDDMAANIAHLNETAANTADRGNAKVAARAAKIVSALDEQRRAGYHPLMRFGDYYAHVTPKAGTDEMSSGGFPRTVSFELAERRLQDSLTGGTRVGNQSPPYAKEMLDRLRAQYPADRFNIEHGYLAKNPDMLDRVDIPAIEKLMTFMENDMLHGLRQEARGRGMSKADARDYAKQKYDDLYGRMVDQLWEKAFKELESGYKKRSRTVPGYSQDFDRALGTYMHWTSRNVADQIHREAADNAFTSMETDPRVNSDVKRYWRNWRDYQSQPSNIFNKGVNGMARWGFLTAMGLNPSSTAVVGAHGLFMAGPTLSVGIGPKAFPAYFKALGHALSGVKVDGGGLHIDDVGTAARTSAEKAYLAKLDQEGMLHSRAIEDMAALNEKQSSLWGSARSQARKIMDMALSNVSVMDRANRIASALSSYRLAQDPATMAAMDKAWSSNQIWRDIKAKNGITPETLSRFMVSNMVGEYGRTNQAPIERNAASRMMLGMHGFVTRLLQAMWKMGSMGPEGQKALLWTLGAFWTMAGVDGVPFAQDVQNFADYLWKKASGKDPMIGYRIQAELASMFGKPGADMILHGPASALSGVDVASRLGLGDLISRNWPDAENVLGAYPSIIMGRAVAANSLVRSGQYEAAAAQAFPAGIRNVIMADAERRNGIRTRAGRPLVQQENVGAPETVARGLGFTPEKAEHRYQANDFRYRAKHSRMGAPPNPVPGYADGGRVHEAAREADREPSQAQIEAGNYRKGHIRLHGFDISVETPIGAARRGIGKDGKPWENRHSTAHYGYIKRTHGADGEHVDCYVGPHHKSPRIFVVNQIEPGSKRLDEHKIVMGARTMGEAKAIYDEGFSDGSGPKRRWSIREMTPDTLRDWLNKGSARKPLVAAA